MVIKKPRVSIGLPVYNGEAHIEDAISSILAQSYSDFELVISDNGSIDKTQEICSEYAEKDGRISYYRLEKNLGAARNFNRVFELSSGEFFKWAASDDVIAPEYLFKCLNVLEQNPSVVLVHSKTGRINKSDEITGKYDCGTIIDSLNPNDRFKEMLNRKGFPWIIFGLFRKDVLGRTSLFGDYIGSDWNLLAEISLYGRILEIPDLYFFRRDHERSYTTKHYAKFMGVRDYHTESKWWSGKQQSNLIILPHWKHLFEFFKSVTKVKMSFSNRYLCYEEIIRWLLKDGKRLMKWDISNELKLWRMSLNKKRN
jgi:glycosyltransferase involved in cell wall biosynthesis